jgi:hypothetical protein
MFNRPPSLQPCKLGIHHPDSPISDDLDSFTPGRVSQYGKIQGDAPLPALLQALCIAVSESVKRVVEKGGCEARLACKTEKWMKDGGCLHALPKTIDSICFGWLQSAILGTYSATPDGARLLVALVS